MIIRTSMMMLFFLSFSFPSFAQLYKCQVDGKTLYQDQSCQGALEIDTSDIEVESQIVARRKQKEQIELRLHPKKLRIGMPSYEVTKAWGNPSQVNRSVLRGSVHEQWVYSFEGGKTRYAYLDNGYLTSYSE